MNTPSHVKRFDKRCIAIHTGVSSYLDHLGPLSILLNIPMIVSDPLVYQDARRYYPDLNLTCMNPSDLSLPFLAENFDVILSSGHYWAVELIPLLKLFCQKDMRVIYCPHGNSDKGWSRSKPLIKDLTFIYGPQMLARLDDVKDYIVTGNYRFPYYLERKDFYDKLLAEELAGRLSPLKKTLLYAPTWNDPENPTTFFTDCENLLKDLSSYNVIVKLHPFLFDDHPIEVEKIKQNFPDAVFLLNFPPIYPILNYCDAYVGDFSSIGYDFLSFDKPLFFLTESKGILSQTGLVLPSHDKGSFIEKNWQADLKHKRQEIYQYAFGESRDMQEVRLEMERALMHESPTKEKITS
ncbi:MAG: CDP-glycerol glycerophosphotransferase family protein [Verrucomicrobia bacterium]|nr:CDP-glycerol glycerophosphotransferase family protein [Verrucomicrobiota bacterium]